MLKQIKQSKELKVHLESGDGYYVVEHKLIPFNLKELDDVEVGKYIIENATITDSHFNIKWKTRGSIYNYSIYNNGEYEFSESTEVYSLLYFTEDEFNKMCETAQRNLKEKDSLEKDVHHIKSELKKLYPDTFLNIANGQMFNSYEWD